MIPYTQLLMQCKNMFSISRPESSKLHCIIHFKTKQIYNTHTISKTTADNYPNIIKVTKMCLCLKKVPQDCSVYEYGFQKLLPFCVERHN